MNKNEKMYDAITNIRDDIIEKAGKYSFEKKKRNFAWIGYAAAVCLLAGAAVFGLSRIAMIPVCVLYVSTNLPVVISAPFGSGVTKGRTPLACRSTFRM